MNSEEQTQAVQELEEKVERLRALYEQYFMGIEKIEPLIPRKDVDRRLWVLRREQIRNTGLRFKLQQVVSRYNTFGMYWQRILREIENGTYKRDVARAAKRFGSEALTIAAKRRLGKKGLAEIEAAEQTEKAKRERPVAQTTSEDEGESTSPFRRSEIPLSQPGSQRVDQTIPDAAPPPALSLPPVPPRPPPKPKAAPVRLDLDFEDDDELFAGLEDRAVSRPPSAPRPLPSGSVMRPSSSPAERVASVPPARPSAPQSSPGTAAPPPPRPSAPQPPSSPQPAAAATPMRSGLASGTPIRSGLASSGNPFAPRAVAPAAPKPAAVPVRPATVAPSPPPARRDDGDVSEARVKELFTKYVEAKKQCNESTSTITTDSLAKSLRESASKLRQKHAGKNVDFDVVIKDGKAVLKPVLKG